MAAPRTLQNGQKTATLKWEGFQDTMMGNNAVDQLRFAANDLKNVMTVIANGIMAENDTSHHISLVLVWKDQLVQMTKAAVEFLATQSNAPAPVFDWAKISTDPDEEEKKRQALLSLRERYPMKRDDGLQVGKMDTIARLEDLRTVISKSLDELLTSVNTSINDNPTDSLTKPGIKATGIADLLDLFQAQCGATSAAWYFEADYEDEAEDEEI
jgi:hypothetical protein